MKALAAGKHVMCEKPMANTEEETRKMFTVARAQFSSLGGMAGPVRHSVNTDAEHHSHDTALR